MMTKVDMLRELTLLKLQEAEDECYFDFCHRLHVQLKSEMSDTDIETAENAADIQDRWSE